MSPLTFPARILLLGAMLATAGCIPPPADIGVDYSGPLYRKPGADAPRTASSGLPPTSADAECKPVAETPTRKRSDCGIRRVMERHNPGLQSLYQRRLAEDNTLKGNMVLRLIIGADGSVQAVDVASSEINDNELTRQIAAYMRTVNFGPLDAVPSWSDTYTLEFSPPKDLIPAKAVDMAK